ncbi:MAG TPA: GGDEF domain-containing protein [Gemmatimonadales bacterium]|nr:GGDEF domain-containing protein [Gemmatimonadales bacterium]
MAPSPNPPGLWSWLTAPPDEILADAARDGEMLVARIRTWLTLMLLMIPVVSLAIRPAREHWIGLGVTLVAVVCALGIDLTVRRGLYRPSISIVTSIADVSLVSLGLVLFWLIGMPIVTTNARVVFEAYFIAIGASAMRYSPRASAVSGFTAMGQFLLLSWASWRFFPPSAMAVGSEQYGSFDWATQIARLTLLLGMTVVALAIVSRTTRLRRLSTFDRLTGLYNRAYIEEYLGHELAGALRSGRPFVVAMLDVDHFKHFNDTHGHAAGDQALRALADILRSSLRRSDVVARYGGEEFLVAMQGTTMPAAMDKLDELRVKVGLSDIALPRGGDGRITVSTGVAVLGPDGDSLASLLDAADQRLYQAKEEGRNRVVGFP